MTKAEEIQSQLDNITTSADNIAADIKNLQGGTLPGGLTPDEATGILTNTTALAAKVKAIADIVPEIPPTSIPKNNPIPRFSSRR